ncbi:MAG TPA: cytochrome P450 [Ilumatobacteraceae bacterium]|nr:cytochrome P450 [Ilumatobacteraceae bacterium]
MNPLLAYETLDAISNEAYRSGPPHDLYQLMRREAPIVKHRGIDPGSPPWFWAISRHADVVEVSRRFQTYSSARKGALVNQDRPDLEIARMMIDTDPPEHTRLRNLVSRGFTPKVMRQMEEHFHEVAARLIDDAVAAGDVEFVDAVSSELPLVAIAELLGIPYEDRRKVFDWSNRMIGATDPDYTGGVDDATAAAAELYMYANEMAALRRIEPRDDLVTTLISAEGDDELSEHEFDLFVLLLAVAGNETTRNGISHGLLALIEHPDAFDALKSDPSMVASGVEEMLRWGTPVNNFLRTATCDTVLHGTQIHEGDAVVMLYASANRDEKVFADPFRFDVTRHPNPHLTFGGGGPHHCLGFNLAKMEMRIVFEELIARVTRVELIGEVTKLRSAFIHGIKQLPVRLHAG